MRNTVAALMVVVLTAAAHADDWPQWLGPQRDGVWREAGVARQFPAGGPKQRWRVPVGLGYAGPAVVGNRVIVADRVITKGSSNPSDPFKASAVPGVERVLCLDDKTGNVLWKHEYDCPYRVSYPAGPRCTPVVAGERVYTLGAMGDLYCLDLATGNVVWERHFLKDYNSAVPLWGFSAHPLLDGDRLVCLAGSPQGSDETLVIALHKDTGKEVWKSGLRSKEPGYCPPTLATLGGLPTLIAWVPSSVNGLDPATGAKLWSVPFEVKAALTIPTPRVLPGDRVFVTSFYNGSRMIQVGPGGKSAKVVWQGKSNSERPDKTDGLHAIMSTPVVRGEYIYGVDSYGELRCIEAATGKRVWMTMKATRGDLTPETARRKDEPTNNERWAHAFIVEQGDSYLFFNEQGDLIRAELSPEGYKELGRAKLIEPTNEMARRPVVWMHPAFANQSVYARNDKELACFSLAE